MRLDFELFCLKLPVQLNICTLVNTGLIVGELQLNEALYAFLFRHSEFLLFKTGHTTTRELAVDLRLSVHGNEWLHFILARANLETAHASRVTASGLPLEELPRRGFSQVCRQLSCGLVTLASLGPCTWFQHAQLLQADH